MYLINSSSFSGRNYGFLPGEDVRPASLVAWRAADTESEAAVMISATLLLFHARSAVGRSGSGVGSVRGGGVREESASAPEGSPVARPPRKDRATMAAGTEDDQ